jgi:hypothetical protein
MFFKFKHKFLKLFLNLQRAVATEQQLEEQQNIENYACPVHEQE